MLTFVVLNFFKLNPRLLIDLFFKLILSLINSKVSVIFNFPFMDFSDEEANIHKKLDHSLFLQLVLATNFIFNTETIVKLFKGILKIGRRFRITKDKKRMIIYNKCGIHKKFQ